MNNIMNTWITIGKRKELPPLDHLADQRPKLPHKPTGQQSYNRLSGRSRRERKSAPKLQIQEQPRGNAIEETVVKDQMIESGEIGTSPPILPPIHPRFIPTREILLEVCLIDRINVEKYQTLESRQKSMVNLILACKYHSILLEVIDSGGFTSIETETYLKEPPKHSCENVMMYYRLRALLDSVFPKLWSDPSLRERPGAYDHLAKRYFGNMILGLVGLPPSEGCPLFQEVVTVRRLAPLALSTGRELEWLSGMVRFLEDLLKVSQEEILSEYEKSIERKLSILFYDEDFNLNRFFVKLRTIIKSGKVDLPMTIYEVRELDSRVISNLNYEKRLLTSFLLSSNSILKSRDYILNYLYDKGSLHLFENSNRESTSFTILPKIE